ncbi:DNA polymerase III subunit chi [Roseiarcaceae bacterium H3SJ34-1]|uniref:DNA polymerase III subunit chi n=1 Tax=Terripilifer ovatus TaxID=3032367 RepID=UPI003AB9A649|nr:DNA polymerase III subunit chi [Roseiarcaceae bacterium H3SJ34-1]
MTEVWFYHLTLQPLERVLPVLLEKTVQRGWRGVVQTGAEERLAALDDLLWTYSDESFLAHGTARDGDSDITPVYLTAGAENPNGAQARFLVHGADTSALTPDGEYERVLILFDGNDDDQLQAARADWKRLKEAGFGVSYWQQGETGGWDKKA